MSTEPPFQVRIISNYFNQITVETVPSEPWSDVRSELFRTSVPLYALQNHISFFHNSKNLDTLSPTLLMGQVNPHREAGEPLIIEVCIPEDPADLAVGGGWTERVLPQPKQNARSSSPPPPPPQVRTKEIDPPVEGGRPCSPAPLPPPPSAASSALSTCSSSSSFSSASSLSSSSSSKSRCSYSPSAWFFSIFRPSPPPSPKELKKKIVLVGDKGSGKTELIIMYAKKEYPRDYVPTVFDNYTCQVPLGWDGSTKLLLQLWDTAGQEEFDAIRPFSYPNTDVFLLCFSVDSKEMLSNVKAKWVGELKHHCPKAKLVLVGNNAEITGQRVTKGEAEAIATAIGAVKYMECSARNNVGVKEIFDFAIRTSISEDETCCIL